MGKFEWAQPLQQPLPPLLLMEGVHPEEDKGGEADKNHEFQASQ